MLKNLLRKGGCTTTRNFSNPCPKLRIVTKNESVEEKKSMIQKRNTYNPSTISRKTHGY
jgi:hypothetical protein